MTLRVLREDMGIEDTRGLFLGKPIGEHRKEKFSTCLLDYLIQEVHEAYSQSYSCSPATQRFFISDEPRGPVIERKSPLSAAVPLSGEYLRLITFLSIT